MKNLLRHVEPIRAQDLFFSPISGTRKFHIWATRDVGAAAATLLLDRSWTGIGGVAVFDPEDLSFQKMARRMSGVPGGAVRFRWISRQHLNAMLMKDGMSEVAAQSLANMVAARGLSLDNVEPRTAESTTLPTFRKWCEEVVKLALSGAFACDVTESET